MPVVPAPARATNDVPTDGAAPAQSSATEPLEMDMARRQARCGGRVLELGGRAFDLLVALTARPGDYIDPQELTAAVWPGRVVEPQNLRVQINNLRQQLGAQALSNLPGRGYRLELPVRRAAPPPAQRLIGREDDQRRLQQLVDTQRLLTVTGTGGIGKTSLVRDWFGSQDFGVARGGAWVDLAGAGASQVLALAAAALGLRDGGKAWTVDRLAAAVPTRPLLLVLDNAEHLLPAVCTLVRALLQAAPALHVVVTSQIALRLPDEQVLRLAPLALPAPGTPLAQALGRAALQLLVERVRAVEPAYALAESELADAITLCRRLDGVPLAIELAAARVPALGLHTLVESLDERLQLLHSPQHSRPQRQQTLRAALEWTHGLLDTWAQAAFARLGVFTGAFSLSAALAVTADAPGGSGGAGAGPLDRTALIDAMQALVDASLLVAEATDAATLGAPGDGPAYRLLETPRLYALQRLHDSGQHDALRQRHLAWCLAWVPDASTAEVHAGQSQLKVALDWALSGGDPHGGALLAERLLAHPGLSALQAPTATTPGPVDDTLPRLLQRLRSAGVIRQAERAGVAPDTLLAMARRLRPTETRDLDGAVRELLQAVELIRNSAAPTAGNRADTTADTLLEQTFADIAEHARHGRFDESSDRIDQALDEMAQQEVKRRAAYAAARRRLMDSGLQQDLLRRDAFAVARRIEALVALDTPERPTHSAAWLQREEDALRRGQVSTGLWLEVATELVRRRLADARTPAERVGALRTLASALSTRGEQQGDALALEQAADACREALAGLSRHDDDAAWGALQHELAHALALLGMRANDAALLAEAVACCERALQVRTRAQAPMEWAATQHTRGNALRCLGMSELGTERLEQAALALREALHERTPGRAPLDRAKTLNVLGITLSIWASREDTPRRHLEALAAQQSALALTARDEAPVLWGTLCNNIGIEYNFLGSGGVEPESSWRSAIDAFRRALLVQTRESVPANWARTQHNLATSLAYLGEHLSDPDLVQQAEQAFEQSLLENTLERQPFAWASSKNELGSALMRRGRLTPGTAGAELIAAGVQQLQSTLLVRRADTMPNEWLRTKGDIAVAELRLAQHTGERRWAQQAADTAAMLLEHPSAAQMPVERLHIGELLEEGACLAPGAEPRLRCTRGCLTPSADARHGRRRRTAGTDGDS